MSLESAAKITNDVENLLLFAWACTVFASFILGWLVGTRTRNGRDDQ